MKRGVRASACVAALVAGASVALAQSGGGYTVRRDTIDGGGERMSGANGLVLTGTVGQADAGVAMSGANGYALTGGFWSAGVAVERPDALFADGFE
jgi:hypothetical protein